MPKITKRLVDALESSATSEVFVWDSDLKGFGIRLKPSGARSYLVQYRNAEGRTRRLAIGKAGTLTPDEARLLARDKLAAVAKGADPSAERHARREALTVAELCDWYLSESAAGRLLGRNGRPVKASTLAMDRSRIETHVKPLIGKRAARSLTLDDIEDMQADIVAGRTAKARDGRGGVTTGGAGVAARTVGMLHTIFEQAARKKQIPSNPADGARKVAGQRRRRRLSLEDVTALGCAMREAEHEGENATALAAIRAFLLTGFRRMEVLAVRKEWLGETRTGGFVSFPDTKTGEQVRPIGRAALATFRQIRSDTPWAFPGERSDGHFVGVVKVLDRVCKRAGLKDVSPHVLRHTFASVAGDLGFTKLTIAGLLGHAAGGDTESYVHLDTALLTAADRVSDHIAAALDGREPGAAIVPLRREA
jgi:integrase